VLARWSAHKAVRIVTDSEFSAGEIRGYLDLPASEVDVIPLGLSPPTWNVTGTPRPAREPLVLYVGSIFNRRHVSDLVRAFARVARQQPHARLVIAGENRTFPREDPAALALHLGIADRVSVRPYVPDAELGELYARARVFAFLSEYEGFGLTPLEALAAGVPTVVYDTPVAREVYADAVDYVTVGAIDQVASAIDRLLTDADACAERLARTPAVLARYDWERTAHLTLGVLTRAATHGRRP
jgi:glycosyltransferase involved in cell wall biosynthesis